MLYLFGVWEEECDETYTISITYFFPFMSQIILDTGAVKSQSRQQAE
jgi:hypothetical protein